mmetsp:Transcript_8839/g.14184  ORF Transcript_8839/g.14184 Transcript_8839/m.14184 type:complete len:92 (+) Transcript_8839:87-362(+)
MELISTKISSSHLILQRGLLKRHTWYSSLLEIASRISHLLLVSESSRKGTVGPRNCHRSNNDNNTDVHHVISAHNRNTTEESPHHRLLLVG